MTFKAINWTPTEQIGETKMDTMADNTEWLYKNSPRSIYTLPGGLRRVEGIRVASGRAIITKRKSDSATVEVRFGNYFSTYCEPNITTGVISATQPRIFCTINGVGRLIPDHRGFQVAVNVAANSKKKDKITRTMYVAWQAMGY